MGGRIFDLGAELDSFKVCVIVNKVFIGIVVVVGVAGVAGRPSGKSSICPLLATDAGPLA